MIYTGWDKMWNKENFVKESPHFTKKSMNWIIERGISILGLDIPCSEDPQNREDLNSALFKSGALLLAPVVNLAQISRSRLKLIALPLKIKGRDFIYQLLDPFTIARISKGLGDSFTFFIED